MTDFAETSFHLPKDAVIQFQDVVGEPVVDPDLPRTPYGDPDADAYLFGQAGNDGYFSNIQFPIGRFPMAANHYGLVLPQLRETQWRLLQRDGIDPDAVVDLSDIHPDQAETIHSLGKALVAVANHAPRETSNGNGDPFYVGTVAGKVEFFAQAPYFSALKAHGLIEQFFEVSPAMFREKEFFRSKEVSTARRNAPLWLHELTDTDQREIIPQKEAPYPRFIDRFGNVIIDAPSGEAGKLKVDSYIPVHIGSAFLGKVRVRAGFEEAITGELALMIDSENDESAPRQSVFLVRKVNDPVAEADTNSAFIAIAKLLADHDPENFQLSSLHSFEIEFGDPE